MFTILLEGMLIQRPTFHKVVLRTLNTEPDTHSPEDSPLPPLSDLIDENNIIGDVQFLLDFAIIGHPKTGTTALLNWLRSHEEVQMHDEEVRSLRKNKPAGMVSLLYDLPYHGKRRGYKAPNDIQQQVSLNALHPYWPCTKCIVGLRHPVKWMESFYKFQSQQNRPAPSEEGMME